MMHGFVKILLCLVLVFGVSPMAAFADSDESAEQSIPDEQLVASDEIDSITDTVAENDADQEQPLSGTENDAELYSEENSDVENSYGTEVLDEEQTSSESVDDSYSLGSSNEDASVDEEEVADAEGDEGESDNTDRGYGNHVIKREDIPSVDLAGYESGVDYGEREVIVVYSDSYDGDLDAATKEAFASAYEVVQDDSRLIDDGFVEDEESSVTDSLDGAPEDSSEEADVRIQGIALDDAVANDQAEADEAKAEIEPFCEYKILEEGVYLNQERMVRMQLPEDLTVAEGMGLLLESPAVDMVEPNFYYQLCESTTEEEIHKKYDTGYMAQANRWHLDAIGAEGTWNLARSNRNVGVVVIDSGIQTDHPDLQSNIVYSFDVDASNPFTGSMQETTSYDGSHGTRVAGVVSAVAGNRLGAVGVSYNANIINAKIDFTGNSAPDGFAIIKALHWVMQNASTYNIHVVNMSFFHAPTVETQVYDSFIESYINTLYSDYNVVSVAAAGNYTGTATVYPSDFANCVSVMALSDPSTLAGYSAYGSAKDVCAPGSSIYTTTTGSSYTLTNGTSFSAPVVSGILAVEFAASPSMSAASAVQYLYGGCTSLGSSGTYGYGCVNAAKTLWSILPRYAITKNIEGSSYGNAYQIQAVDGTYLSNQQNYKATVMVKTICNSGYKLTRASYTTASGSTIAMKRVLVDGEPSGQATYMFTMPNQGVTMNFKFEHI